MAIYCEFTKKVAYNLELARCPATDGFMNHVFYTRFLIKPKKKVGILR